MDSYGADFSVLCVATCECVAVLWVYGKCLSTLCCHPFDLW